MKIAFLVQKFPPYIGGIPTRAFRIAKGLTEKGHEITVYTSNHKQTPKFEKINGMRIKRYKLLSPSLARFAKAPTLIMPEMLELFRDKEIDEADIVQSFYYISFVSLVAASLKLVKGKIFAHQPGFMSAFIEGKATVPYDLTLGRSVIRYADLLTPETGAQKDSLIRLRVNPEKIKVIPCAINSLDYEQLPNPTVFRRKYNIDSDEKIVLFAGRPGRWKGLHHLILAMQSVLSKVEKTKLVVAGPDVATTEFLLGNFGSSKVRKNTIVTGPLAQKSLASAYSASDVLALPSKGETFGLVLLEAAASGLPIVSTPTGVAPDLIINGKNGLFVGYGKVDQIAEAIIRVLMSDDFKIESERRRKDILQSYDSRMEIDRYEKAYLDLIAEAGRR